MIVAMYSIGTLLVLDHLCSRLEFVKLAFGLGLQ